MFDRTRRVAKGYFNVKTYMGLESLKANGKLLGELAKGVFKVSAPKRQETFDEAIERLSLTEEAIQKRQRLFFRLSLLFLLAAVLTFFYGFYILAVGRLPAFGLDLAVVTLLLSQAFRYHFWFFQMKNRKLGCTFNDWWNTNLRGEVK